MKSDTLYKLEQQILQSLYTLHHGVPLVDENQKRTMSNEFEIVPDWLLDAWLPEDTKRGAFDLNNTLKVLEQLELITPIKMEKWTWLAKAMYYQKNSREYVLVKPYYYDNKQGNQQKPNNNTCLLIVVGRFNGTGKFSKSRDELIHNGPGESGFDSYKLTKDGLVLVRESLIKPAKSKIASSRESKLANASPKPTTTVRQAIASTGVTIEPATLRKVLKTSTKAPKPINTPKPGQALVFDSEELHSFIRDNWLSKITKK